MTYEDQDLPIGCGCEDHDLTPIPDTGSAHASRRRFLRTAAGLAVAAPAMLAAACGSGSSSATGAPDWSDRVFSVEIPCDCMRDWSTSCHRSR